MGHKQLQYDYSKICQNVNSCVYLQFTTLSMRYVSAVLRKASGY